MMRSRTIAGLFGGALLAAALLACNEKPLKHATADAGAGSTGLAPDLAARTVAKVGSRTITLAEFAAVLERMNQFDRLRYQTKERRRELLDEMINVELLAAEAKRLGLDKEPEAQDAIRLILRDAMIAGAAREGVPTPAEISEQEVRAYFEGHPDKFFEPERRRVAAIVMSDKKEAAKVLKEALKTKTANEWGELVFKHSLLAPKTRGPTNPVELAGDLGIVGPMDDARGSNAKVPDAVRAAVFKLKDVNEVGSDLVEVDGRQYIVRLNGLTPPHKRTLAEADRSIRVQVMQDKMAERERAVEAELRAKFPVEIDDAALASVKVPLPAETGEAEGAHAADAGADGKP